MHRSIPFLRFPKSNPYSPQTLLSASSKRLFSTVSRLQSRAVVRFRGSDTIKFLHGLLTNDVRRFGGSEGQHPAKLAMYSALLTPQGRVLYDIFVYSPPPRPVSDGSFELLVDVDRSEVEEFLATLTRYRLRAKVEIENVAEEFSCWQWYGGELSKKLTSAEEPVGDDQSSGSYSQVYNQGWQWFRDPRLDCLGYRGIFPSNAIPPLVEADKEADEQNYIMWRLENGVAESSAEIPKGEAIPLEYNLVGLHAISFEKGCYVGQELVARTHHRGVIRKRLVPLKFLYKTGQDVEVQLTPGLEVTNSTTGKKAGTITTALGNRGLGVLRLDDAFKSSSTLALQGQDIEAEAIRPEWWPSEWSTEHQ